MRLFRLALATLALAACAPAARPAPTALPAASAASPADRAAALEPRLAALARATGGTVAATVVHVPSGARASVNGGVRLPMMSVFKLPLAIVTLAAVDEGRRAMSERVPIAEGELRTWVSPVADGWAKGEKAPTLETILRTAVADSDNTSGDELVTSNGGGPAVTARLRALGLDGVDVGEQEIEIAARVVCAGTAPPPGGWTDLAIRKCPDPSPDAKLAAARREAASTPNAASADALAALLARLDGGEVLTASSRAWLGAVLDATQTGPGRLRAGLPPGTRLGHKTGTGETVQGFNVATNDVGLAHLPDGSRLAIAVLTSGVPGTDDDRAAVIADVARAAWEAFAR
jgi:beta-lactamase class A